MSRFCSTRQGEQKILWSPTVISSSHRRQNLRFSGFGSRRLGRPLLSVDPCFRAVGSYQRSSGLSLPSASLPRPRVRHAGQLAPDAGRQVLPHASQLSTLDPGREPRVGNGDTALGEPCERGRARRQVPAREWRRIDPNLDAQLGEYLRLDAPRQSVNRR